MMSFTNLFRPLIVKDLVIPNRICMPAMDVNLGNDFGEVTDRHVYFLEARARGGVGLIVVEASHVSLDGKLFPHSLGIDRDDLIPGLRRLVEACHRHGSKVAIQINHAGRQTYSKWTGYPLIAPSAIPCPRRKEMPREMTVAEIHEMTGMFAEAARRALEAGFDAIEIHGAHGYLISGFMSPHSNRRQDEYGGDAERRMRFPVEIVRAVRAVVGERFPILFRFSADEYVEDGLTLDDSRYIARRLQEEGVDILSVSGAVYGSVHMMISPMQVPAGYMVGLSAGIKQEVRLPVITVGRIYDPHQAERILADGQADMVALGRALLSDPEFPNKVREGHLDNISYCVACLHCVGPSLFTSNIKCLQNLTLGREGDLVVEQAQRSKHVLVVGGGPAGLEAARTAARRGHRVTLCEREPALGGQVKVAARPPGKEIFWEVAHLRERELRQMGVEIRTNCTVTPDLVRQYKPDVVVLATGSTPAGAAIEINHPRVCSAHQILNGAPLEGGRAVIVGGGSTGCETADFLAHNGYEVTIVHRGTELAADINERTRTVLKLKFAECGVRVLMHTAVRAVVPEGVVVNGGELLEADVVVLATGVRSVNNLQRALEAEGFEVRLVGDARDVGDAMTAVEDGFRIAMEI